MRPNGRVLAAAALAVSMCCGGSLPPPATQPATGAPPAQSPAATGAIAGRVVSAADRRPLARARIALASPALPEPRVAITGPDGAYEFTRLPAGEYSLAVSRTGFARQRYGERRSARPPVIPVAAGQNVAGIEIAIAPAGVIAGQILDEDGQPFAGALVEALVPRVESSQPTLASVATANSDDMGAFRLTGLPAGQYYVSAADPAFTNVGDETGPLTYTPTYYPGTPHADQARRVDVVPGVEPALKAVFSLKIVRPAAVSGRLVTPDERPLRGGAVIMNPIPGEGVPWVPARDLSITPEGTFSSRNVPPGHYQIRARADVEPQGVAFFSMYNVTVDGRDLADLEMTLSPGATVEGTLAVEAISTPKPGSFAGIRVRAPFVDGSSFGDGVTGDVGPDGRYRIRGLMPGSHFMTVEGLSYPWVVKTVAYKGRDISDGGLDVHSGQELRDVLVTITDAATEVSGAVKDEGGRAAPDAMVLIMPSPTETWTRTSRRFRLLRTDASGRFQVRGLPPGEYRAVATYDLDESETYRRDLLRELARDGVPLSIGDRQRRAVDLPLVSLPAARRTVSR